MYLRPQHPARRKIEKFSNGVANIIEILWGQGDDRPTHTVANDPARV